MMNDKSGLNPFKSCNLPEANEMIKKVYLSLEKRARAMWSENNHDMGTNVSEKYMKLMENKTILTEIIHELMNTDYGEEQQEAPLKTFLEEGARMKSHISRVEAEIASHEEQIDAMNRKQVGIREEILSKVEDLDKQIEKIESYCSRCSSELGLDIVMSEENVILFKFKSLSKSPVGTDRFLCEIQASSSESKPFSILTCKPDLGEELKNLEAVLNQTQDLSGFVFTLRNKFLSRMS